jgi:DNA-binding response OmpR family regulator
MLVEPRTILAVDQDPATQALLEITLNSGGYRTTVAGDSETAFDLLDHFYPAIVLFDEETMGPTLHDFVSYARSLEPTPYLILASKNANGPLVAQGLGIQNSLVKPFDPNRLFNLVTQLPQITAGGTQIAAPAVECDTDKRFSN